MVSDTDCQISGCVARSLDTTVLLPTPDGPDSTVSRRAGVGNESRVEALTESGGPELTLECCDLISAKSANSSTF